MKVTRVLILSIIAIMSHRVLGTTRCNCTKNDIPSKIAPLLDCIPKHDDTCLGEEVKCLRVNVLRQPQLGNLTGNWDGSLTFFNQYLDKINATYQSRDHTPCPWKYVEQYDANRYPRYIHNVRCHSPQHCHDNGGNMVASCVCQEVKYTMPILRRTKCDNGKQDWEINYETVNVACIPRFY